MINRAVLIPFFRLFQGLTPLYHGILAGASEHCCELLLNERAILGNSDDQGCSEIHVACRNGLDRHLDHLIFYGANLNSRTETGNTPLHICAARNQEDCARILLFRGADPTLVNFANQLPHDLASISGHNDLAALIRDFDPSQVARFVERPVYSRRRRGPTPNSNASSPSLKLSIHQPTPGHGELLRSSTVPNKGELKSLQENGEEMFLNNNVRKTATETDKKRPESDEDGSECSDSEDEAVSAENKINRRTFSTGVLGKKAPAPMRTGQGKF